MNTNEEKEREDFEAWLLQEHGLDATWEPERNCFKEFPAHLAWKAWLGRAALRAESEPVNLHRYINAANISASDAPHVVVEKLQKAINTAPQTEPKDTGSEI